MKRKVARLRLSPNEEARLLREEYERRRKLRIQQVREQQRDIALHIRREVEQRRQHELEQLEKQLREDWERQQRDKLNTLQKLYHESLQLVGQGHRSAKENEPDLAAIAQKEEENHIKAEERYREALKDLKSQRLKDFERQSQTINARKKALQAEKERSAKVASLPPPPPNPIENIDPKKPHVVRKSDVSAFATTHYHLSQSIVDRERDAKQPNAHEGAELELRRLEDLQREIKRRREEQLEKARLRGKRALKREHLEQDRERLLVELEHMQQTDMLRRRQQVSKMPAQIFQPLYQRQQVTEDFQREMEFAFEDMYTGERRVKGDLVVQLVPEPLPALSTGSQDQELDVTLDEVATPVTENEQDGIEQEAGSARQETSAKVDSSRPAPRRALKKLLDRIRSQTNEQTELNCHGPVTGSPTAFTDQIPERDSTIDTGSMTSEEKDKLSATEPPEASYPPAVVPPALETTEQPAAADIVRLDVLTDGIQEFTEERRKRAEELEKEMQQQVALLQELEEQKARLEQMLLEAQQERENLKAAVTQEVPVSQAEEPTHDQDVTPITAGPASEPPPGEDDHTRKVREYQQRLLEQNRVHRRSVEVAHHRLEEYQRALQTRYGMTVSATPPSVEPPRLIHTHLLNARSARPPTALPLPTAPTVLPCIPAKLKTSVKMPTIQSDMLPPPHPPFCSLKEGSTKIWHESVPNRGMDQRSDESAWLTDGIMEKVTKHLPERLRPVSVTREPSCQSTSIPLQPTSDSLQAVSPTITDGAPLLPGHTVAKGGILPHGSVVTVSLSSNEVERQRWDLQQAQTRMLEQREALALQQRQQEEERKRLEVEMEHMRKQKEALQTLIHTDAQISEEMITASEHLLERGRYFSVARGPQHDTVSPMHQSTSVPRQPISGSVQAISPTITDVTPLVPSHAAVIGGTLTRTSLPTGSLSSTEHNMERRRRELHQRQQEEEKKRVEVELEQMRRQKETLKALIDTDANPAPEAASEVLGSESISQTRLKLLASLLRAIEETNGGTLSQLQDPQEINVSPQQLPSNNIKTAQDPISRSNVPAGPSPASVLPSEFLPPPRAAKPPVTRIRLGITEMLTEQHELSAIQEVETPVETSQVTEDNGKAPIRIVDWDPQQESRSTASSDSTLQTPSLSSSRHQTPQSQTSSRTNSERSSLLICRERLLWGAGTSPQYSESDSRLISPLSSDSGRGADYFGTAVTSYRSPTESAHRTPDFDCLSSTTISTGSYVTTDPEQNFDPDKYRYPSLRRRVEQEQEAALLNVTPPSVQGSSVKDGSAAGYPGQVIDALFSDSSIQRIIDRYTNELNISLSATGKPTGGGGSSMEERGSSVSQHSLPGSERREEDENSAVCQALPSDTAGTRRSGLEWVGTLNPVLENFSGEDPSLAGGQEQDSFRPLIGQMTDQSSCLAADPRDASMEQLVGQPSGHSSIIGQPASLSLDQAGWDSTLNRMICQLGRQSSSQWLSGGQDLYADQAASEPSTTWLDGGQEESHMRPLVGELDESAGQHSGSSGERTRVDLGVSTETNVPSYTEASSSRSASVPGVNPHPQDQTLRNQTSVMDLGTERIEALDSFHPLLAEVTHNETAEPSMTFHLPENDAPNSPDGQSASWNPGVLAPSEGIEPQNEEIEPLNDPSESEHSPEHLRTEEPPSYGTGSPALHESFSQLITSQCHPCESVLVVSPTLKTDVERTALSLSNLTVFDNTPDVSMPQPEAPFSDVYAGDLKSELGSSLRVSLDSEKEAAGEKGILEQSEITLVSLTDTTGVSLQDKETTVSEEDIWQDDHSEMMEEREKRQHTEGAKSALLQDQTPGDENKSNSVTLLEFQWGPGEGLQEVHQQRRRALLHRSSHRVQQIKTKKAFKRIQPAAQAPSEARDQSVAKDSQPPVSCNAKHTSEPKHETDTEPKGLQQQTTLKSGLMSKKKPQLAPPVRDSGLEKVDEMKICTTEQRKLDVSEMHQRTLRLYEQLEEVKHQKAIRSRQETYAKNRQRAKEFHKKTLQKLRVKQTLQ